MSQDEHADYERGVNGLSLQKIGGVWWYPVRRFFYRPLFLFQDLQPTSPIPRSASLVGGAQHPIPPEQASNSRLNLLVDDRPSTYSLSALESSMRNKIRKGLKSFTFQVIDNVDQLATQGHPVYLDFLTRTQYQHNAGRREASGFRRWAESVFACPKIRVTGAFAGDQLAAVNLSFVVQDVLYYNVYFGNQLAHANRASDAMIHTVRESAAASPSVRLVFGAGAGMPRGLDQFYLERGFRVLSKPALFRGNPLALSALRWLAPDRYRKLMGQMDPVEPAHEEVTGASATQGT